MKYFIYLTWAGMLVNAYQWILPSLGLKQRRARLLLLPLFVATCLHEGILLGFFCFCLIGNSIIFIRDYISKPLWLNRFLLIILGLFAPTYIYFAIRNIISNNPFQDSNQYYYSLAYFAVLFWGYWIWSLVKSKPIYSKRPLQTIAILVSLTALSLLSIWGIRHNPTVYGHQETFTIDGQTHTYRNTEILKFLKETQESMAVKIIQRYDNVTSIEFISTTRYPYRYVYFEGEVLVNKKTHLYYSIDFEHPTTPFKLSESYEDYNLTLRDGKSDKEETWSFSDFKEKHIQEKLKDIDVIYYQKNDIYHY